MTLVDECVYFGDIDEGYERWSFRTKIVITRKDHKCVECARTIRAGEECEYATGFYERVWDVHYTCGFCLQIIRDFVEDNGRMFGALWDHMREAVEISSPEDIPDWDEEDEEWYLDAHKKEIEKNKATSNWFR